MRANLDIENRNILTKKFWSHVKSSTKSTRIPEAFEPLTKANLFNKHFQDQFSNPSSYLIEVDFQNNENFYIEFSVSKVKSILIDLDINKA